MHTHRSHIQVVLAARTVETFSSLATPPKHKSAAQIGSLEQHDNGSWRAYAKGSDGKKRGSLRASQEEALADLSKAREGAANSTDVACGLAALTASRHRAKGVIAQTEMTSSSVAPPAEPCFAPAAASSA